MKLDYKKTIYIGLAFFLICAFWQAYDNIIPKILTDKFGLSQTWSGAVMALDNILALFMLPLFGTLSDRTNTRLGRRTPYIIVGTIAAAVVFVSLAFVDNIQLSHLSELRGDNAASVLYNHEYKNTVKTPGGDAFDISSIFTEDEFTSITTDAYAAIKSDGTMVLYKNLDEAKKAEGVSNANGDGNTRLVNVYTEYVVPLRQAYASEVTKSNPWIFAFFIILLFIVLVSMSIFRSPAVALMPDATIKPLRSKANAIINLMGTCGAIIVLVLGIVFGTGKKENALMSYIAFFSVIAGIMLISLAVFLLKVRERRFVSEMQAESKKYGIEDDESDNESESGSKGGGEEKHRMTAPERRSLLLILASVVLWFFGYNAVISKYSVYAGAVLGLDYNLTLIIAQGAAVVSYLPVGIIASKIGRKKSILAGIVLLDISFFTASFLREGSPAILMNIMFALAGIGWATINVNSFPMVVELSRSSDVGKYTGFYYTASMAAQTLTPIISGVFLDMKMTSLFPYATIFVSLSFLTMLLVRHGDSRPGDVKPSLERFAEVD